MTLPESTQADQMDQVDQSGQSGPAEQPGVPGPARPTLSPGQARALDLTLKIVGLLVLTALGAVTGIYEAFLAPLRLPWRDLRVPLSLLLAALINPALSWAAFAVTGRRLAALLPAGAWCVVWIIAAARTGEGDLIITETNWVGLITLFVGPLAFAVGIYVTVVRRPPAVRVHRSWPRPPTAG